MMTRRNFGPAMRWSVPWRRGATAGLLAILAGCAKPTNPEDLLPPVPRANPGPVSPDGLYNGQMVNTGAVGAMGAECGGVDSFTLTVRDGKFRFVLPQPGVPYRQQLPFDVVVAADGNFSSGGDGRYMRGRFARGHMDAQVSGDACRFDLQADRTGTW